MVMEVAEIMTANPESAQVTATVREVLQKLIEVDVRHLPILDNKELVAMISDRDLREHVMPMTADIDTANMADARFDRPISEFMQGDVIQVHPETDVAEVIDLMIDHRIGAFPVIQPTTGTLVGIVSYIDVIREARSYFEDEYP